MTLPTSESGMPRDLVLDACVALNLLATGELEHVARRLDVRFIMVRQAADESLYLEEESELAESPGRVRVDLQPYISNGTLVVTDLSPEEVPTFVELAAVLDDGEAASIAICIHRQLPLATDDKKARRVAARRGLSEQERTSDILVSLHDLGPEEAVASKRRLLAVEQRARFRPPNSDPNRGWWNGQVGR